MICFIIFYYDTTGFYGQASILLAAMHIAAFLLAGSNTWTLVCGGDIMLNSLKPSKDRLAAIAPYFKAGDVSLANLEVPLTHATKRTPYKSEKELKAKEQFALKADPKQVDLFRGWGLRILTEGNNHAMDYREDGLKEMLGQLNRCGIKHTGAGLTVSDAWKPAVCPLPDGETLSIGAALAFAGRAHARKCCPATGDCAGVATLCFDGTPNDADKKHLRALIAKLRHRGGPVILSLHWGTERMPVPNSYQVTLGRLCIDYGADAVIGAHPHVLQGAELYKGKPILYSMGNLISPLPADCGLAKLTFSGKHFERFRFIPFHDQAGIAKAYAVRESNAAIVRFEKLSELIQKRFPNKFSEPLY